MKKILKYSLLFTSVIIFLLAGCKRQIAEVIYTGGTAPVLSASVSNTVPLSNATQNNTAIVFNWTNPKYQFSTGLSSQNVTYTMEIDTLGANFTNPNKKQIPISSDLSKSFLDLEFNAVLTNDMLLATGIQHTIQVRLIATISGTTATKLVSNILQYTVTPWSPPPAVTPPSSGNLYIVGDATPAGWPGTPLQSFAQEKFTAISSTVYQLTIALNGNGEYKFVEIPGQWANQWSIVTKQSPGDASTLSYTLYYNGDNAKAPQTSGTYLISVDFQHGKVTLTKQ